MNTNKLKAYAPQARREFIDAVRDRAAQFGLTATKTDPMTEQGEVVLIGGHPFPKAVGKKRQKLEARIKKLGFGQTMEAMAYTWFNRLVAIRFMELHGYLEHGYRVLSARHLTTDNTDGTDKGISHLSVSTVKSVVSIPEILEHAQDVDLPGLGQQAVVALKLDGTKEEELYRLLLTAQCNALHKAMPFLFESIDDETELLLPDHLLHSDSLIRNLVNEIPEEDWQEVEIIGWLYQFYISEKKDEVIGKVVASEDIPAATQLFTPNWIVKYLVQNTLGRQWLATYPQSALRQQMKYYIEPAEQTPEVQTQLKAITPASLNPEELTLLDPACGSGHILVEAYDLFKAIYQERGYRAKDIPALILQKNLFGLEIDDRAAQLAAFALMMKARADDRRIFDGDAKPNILAFEDSQGLNAADITHALNSPILKEPMPPKEMLFEDIEDEKAGLFSKKAMAEKGHVLPADIATLLELFENAKTFGSLIQVPPKLAAKLPEIEQRLNDVLKHGDLTHALARVIKPLLRQAQMLARQYGAGVANPPYMGGKYFTRKLKEFVAQNYKDAKADLYACFIQRNLAFLKPNGFVGMITIPNWMFLTSFESIRKNLVTRRSIDTFIHNGRGVFGSDFGSCSFVIRNSPIPAFRGTYRKLFDKPGSVTHNDELVARFFEDSEYHVATSDFSSLPGCPIAFWIRETLRHAFTRFPLLQTIADVRQGLATADDDRFLRLWHEVTFASIGWNGNDGAPTWFPFNKGGSYRRWYGNNEYVVNWKNEGREILAFVDSNGRQRSRPQNRDYYFKEGITWSLISIALPSFRVFDASFIFGHKGPGVFCKSHMFGVLAFLNSKVSAEMLRVLSPSVGFEIGQIQQLPVCDVSGVERLAREAVAIEKVDWDSVETSWDFQLLPAIRLCAITVQQSQELADEEYRTRLTSMTEIESTSNRYFVDAYALNDELAPDVSEDQITLYRPDREEDIKRLISYSIGCMMGRYSLDKPGLICAQSGNKGFDASQYKMFPADEDGILPLTELNWIPEDAANRFEKFIFTAWPAEHLEVNLKFVAETLGPKKGESPRETLRRYLAADFFKHHLSMYKRRPIYWLFSSGKQRGFQALVYLHRYNDGTLSRMRTEYVVPLLGKMKARIDQLTDDIAAANSSQHKKKLETEKSTITKQLAEVQTFEEKLRHCADQRIKLDLDDGVKTNYGKFGDLLAEVKAVTGGKHDE